MPLRILELPQGRFAPVIETTAYLLVARTAAAGECTARVSLQDEAMVVEIHSMPGLEGIDDDVIDRVNALDGHMEIEPRDGGKTVTVRMPLSEAETSMRPDFRGATLSPDRSSDREGASLHSVEESRRRVPKA